MPLKILNPLNKFENTSKHRVFLSKSFSNLFSTRFLLFLFIGLISFYSNFNSGLLAQAAQTNQRTRPTIEIEEPEISPSSTNISSTSNYAEVIPSRTNFGHLERYRMNTKEHWLRRSEITFFISIPFTLLWTDNITRIIFPNLAFLGGTIDGVRGDQYRASNFNYYSDSFPSIILDPFYLFKWIGATIWPLTIAANDFVERGWAPSTFRDLQTGMINNRPTLQLLNRPSF